MDADYRQLGDSIDTAIRVIGLTLDDEADYCALAAHACLSRFHFQRLFRDRLGETPAAFRRRLLLERAAWELVSRMRPVTLIALDAGFDSLEGFSRAFRRAYSVAPSHFRRIAPALTRLPAKNGIHYDPRIRRPLSQAERGEKRVDLTDRLIDHDAWLTRRLLERAKDLTDAQLDAPLADAKSPLPWESPDRTLRKLLERMVFTKEMWVAAVRNRAIPEQGDRSIEGLLARLDASYGEFSELVREVRDERKWDETFVDALCDTPVTFTYGGMIAHVITFTAYRRLNALAAMTQIGIEGLGYGDPIEWEGSLAPS